MRKFSIFFIASLSYLFVYFHRFSIAVLGDQIALDLTGDKNADLSIFTSMYMWSYALMQPFIGTISDLIDPKFIIALSNFLSAAGTFIISLSNNLLCACVGRFLVGIGCSGIFVATNKIGANWLSSDQFRYLSGLLMGIGGAGSLLSQLINFLPDKYTWKICFQVISIVSVVLGLLSLIIIRGRPRDYMYWKENDSTDNTYKNPTPTDICSFFRNFRIILSIPDFWLISVFSFFLPGFFMCISSLWGYNYLISIKFNDRDATFIVFALSISIFIGSPLLPIIAKLVNSRKLVLFMCSMTTFIPCLILMLDFVRNKYLLFLLYFILGFGSNSSQGVALPMFKELVNTCSMEATILGTVNLSPFLGSAVIINICSLVYNTFDASDNDSYKYSIWLIGLCCSLVSMRTATIIRDPFYDRE